MPKFEILKIFFFVLQKGQISDLKTAKNKIEQKALLLERNLQEALDENKYIFEKYDELSKGKLNGVKPTDDYALLMKKFKCRLREKHFFVALGKLKLLANSMIYLPILVIFLSDYNWIFTI